MRVDQQQLRAATARVFTLAGSSREEAETIAKHLIEANLTGHDSHGVIRVSHYVKWLREGRVFANKRPEVVVKGETFAILDGGFGFGQVIGEEAAALGMEMAKNNGVAVVGVRNAGHLGRIGDWAELAAGENLISIHFVNGNGYALLAAPFGGTDKRLSSNPICIGIPHGDQPTILLDIATCQLSQGKIMVAKNKGEELPPNSVLDSQGRPSRDPNVLFMEPSGCILPLSPGHKGYGLSMMCEILAGALTGSDTSSAKSPTVHFVGNGMLSIYLDLKRFRGESDFLAEIDKLISWVKASPTVTPEGEILLPGELESRTKAERLKTGIPLDDDTVSQFVGAALSVGAKKDDFKFLNL